MPKLLVLFQSSDADVVRLAEAAAEGARSVRFAEVDLRQLPGADDAAGTAPASTGRTHHRLQDIDAIGQYDGVVLAVGRNGEGVLRALDGFGGALANKVGSVVTPARGDERRTILWTVLAPMADRGMILVPAPFTDESAGGDEPVRALGKRVAEVIGWVTHARSHHHGHGH
jgi:hypothetical protein